MNETYREEEIAQFLKTRLAEKLLEVRVQKRRRVFAVVMPSALEDAVRLLKDRFNMRHVSTVTGVDLGKKIGVYYHLMGRGEADSSEIVLSLRADTPKDEPKLPTISRLIPGASFYEREVHDMFGVVFESHPDLSPLVLPEGWPEGLYPLRKECTLDHIRSEISKRHGEGK
ncbi:NADH-quinone oxidoreductase subunit C [Candidatus Bathyarchaeota archaeon]|nr:NADH-quinone oxidoreductase subunit C [Candidatus Bathyarchaeota archaeon]